MSDLSRIANALEDIALSLRGQQQPATVVVYDPAPEITGQRVVELLAQYKRTHGQPTQERPEHRACRRQS